MSRIVVYHDQPIGEALRLQHPDGEFVSTSTEEETLVELVTAQVLVTNPTLWSDEFLDSLDQGDWVQTTSAGYALYPVETFIDRGIRFSTGAKLHDDPVSEHVFALLFAFSRNLRAIFDRQDDRQWDRSIGDSMWEWDGKRLTVFGLGNIGENVARRGQALGMDVVGIKRTPSYSGVLSDRDVRTPGEAADRLSDTDAMVLTLPLTEETREIIDASMLERLPERCVLINVGRGGLIDERALITALDEGWIRGAGLDVAETEPIPDDSPLWDFDTVLISPHVGARTTSFIDRFTRLFAYNFDRWKEGDPLANQHT